MRKNSSILSKWIISYIIIVAIPLIGFAAMYSWMRSNVEQYALQVNEEIIQNAYEKINEVIGKVNSSQLSLSGNTRMNQIATYKEMNMEEDFECYLLQKELNGLLNSNENIYHVYIYFPMADICVFETTTMEADKFFLRYYGMDEEESESWKDYLLQTRYAEQEKQTVLEDSISADCIEFLQKYPVTEKKVSAVCVVSVRADKLFAPLIRGEGNSEFFVVNRGDNILFQDTESEWNIEDVAVTVRQGNSNRKNTIVSEQMLKAGWQLYSVTDRDKVLVKVNEIKKLSVILLTVYALVCWCMIQTLTKRNYEPLKKLLHSISVSRNIIYKKNTNEYDWLQEVWTSTREDIRSQCAVVLEKFLLSLLKGKVNEKEWKEKIQKLDLRFVGEDFVVVCFKITELDKIAIGEEKDFNEQSKLELSYFIVNNVATEIFEKNYFVLSVNTDDAVICILNFEDVNDGNVMDDIRQKVDEIKNTIEDYFRFGFLAVISDEYSFYHGIHEAYEQILEGMEHKLFYQKDAVIECAKIEKSLKTDYYYPLEAEQNLIQCITYGNFTEAQKMVNELFRQNFEQIIGNKVLAKCFMSDFMATMVKAVSKVVPDLVAGENSEISSMLNKLLGAGNIYEMKEDIMVLLEGICTHINSKSGSDTSEKMIAIIEENYADTQLSVSFIAERMNLHPVYLGSLFKERTGEKLLDYIARFRIERAKAFMKKQPADTLENIGRRVGYDNVRTFTRVFKKYEGITPAQYKKGL